MVKISIGIQSAHRSIGGLHISEGIKMEQRSPRALARAGLALVVSASIDPILDYPMSQREKLRHWAGILKADLKRPLFPLQQIEFRPREEQIGARREDSPLEVAFLDPVLRRQGLAGDTIGEALKFFELDWWDLHSIVCDCGYHRAPMTPALVAKRIHRLADRKAFRDLRSRISRALGWGPRSAIRLAAWGGLIS